MTTSYCSTSLSLYGKDRAVFLVLEHRLTPLSTVLHSPSPQTLKTWTTWSPGNSMQTPIFTRTRTLSLLGTTPPVAVRLQSSTGHGNGGRQGRRRIEEEAGVILAVFRSTTKEHTNFKLLQLLAFGSTIRNDTSPVPESPHHITN